MRRRVHGRGVETRFIYPVRGYKHFYVPMHSEDIKSTVEIEMITERKLLEQGAIKLGETDTKVLWERV